MAAVGAESNSKPAMAWIYALAATMKKRECVKKKEGKEKTSFDNRDAPKSGGNLVVRGLSGALGGFRTSCCSLCRWSRRGKNVGSSTDSPDEAREKGQSIKGQCGVFCCCGHWKNWRRGNQMKKWIHFEHGQHYRVEQTTRLITWVEIEVILRY